MRTLLPPALLALLPLAVLAGYVARYHVDVPVWDQWELVPLLAKLDAGVLTWGDLWAQHNEHRLFFPRLVMLALARLSRWSITWELALNLVLALALLLVLAGLGRRVLVALGRPASAAWLLPALAVPVFSLQQYENWLWGWQIQIFLNVLAVALGFGMLARAPFDWRAWLAAAACGLVALYSFANGALYWPLGAWLLWRRGARRVHLAAWVGLAAVAAGLYLAGYHPNTGHPPLAAALQQPALFGSYFLAFLGAPLASFSPPLALIAGLLSLLIFAYLTLSPHWLCAGARTAARPLMALGLYALLSALLAALGRAGFGVAQALSSRYVTISNFLVLSIVVLLLAGGSMLLAPAPARRWAVPALLATLLLLTLWSSWQARSRLADRWAYLLPARAALITLVDDGLLARLYPDPAVVRERAAVLRAQGLSVFHAP
jgi:hypothetical protein